LGYTPDGTTQELCKLVVLLPRSSTTTLVAAIAAAVVAIFDFRNGKGISGGSFSILSELVGVCGGVLGCFYSQKNINCCSVALKARRSGFVLKNWRRLNFNLRIYIMFAKIILHTKHRTHTSGRSCTLTHTRHTHARTERSLSFCQ